MNSSNKSESVWTRKSHQSPIFFCLHCKFSTSGTSAETDDKKGCQICPACKRVLIWCHNCRKYQSANNDIKTVRCGSCNTEIVEKNYLFNKNPKS